jgi:hypothetical protein
VADCLGSAAGWESGRALGESGRARPAPTGDEVVCGVWVGAGERTGRVSVVVDGAESSRGPSL